MLAFLCEQLTTSQLFEWFVVVVILLAGLSVGLETDKELMADPHFGKFLNIMSGAQFTNCTCTAPLALHHLHCTTHTALLTLYHAHCTTHTVPRTLHHSHCKLHYSHCTIHFIFATQF
jgi:hypothetical protein